MRNLRWVCVTSLALALAACGGGGGGGDGGSSGGGNGGGGGNGNHAPVANAGPQQNVKTGSLVRLDGSESSDADGDLIYYTWAITGQPAGSKPTLENDDTVRPLLTPDIDGKYIVSLVTNDGTAYGNTDKVTIIARTSNSVPVANVGPDQSVKVGTEVTLDGNASSDADRDALAYRWTFASQPSASSADFADATSPTPVFTPDAAGDYVARLVVSDGKANSAGATVTIRATAASANAPPVANAGGDQGVAVGANVELDGSASSDADGDSLSYAWQRVSLPQGSSATLTKANTAKPTFVADASGSYVLELTVTDAEGATDSDRVVITAGAQLRLEADLQNQGSFADTELPYDEEVSDPPIMHVPDDGFVLGRFRVTAVGGDLTLNFSGSLTRLNDSGGEYSPVVDGLQDYTSGTRQAVIPQGQTVEFTLNVAVPPQSLGLLTYGFSVVETGQTFEASYTVQSDD